MKFNSKLTINNFINTTTMNRYPVKSNNIVFIGYDEVDQLLEIQFKLKVIHQYLEVPLSEFVALMQAISIDEFYFNFIQYKYNFDTF